MVVVRAGIISTWTAVVWWLYVIATVGWIFIFVGIDYANDPTLVIVNASTAELTGLLALSITNVLFVSLANWHLLRNTRNDPRSSVTPDPRKAVNQVMIGFGGLAIISTAFLPALFTSSSIALDSVGGEPEFQLAFMSWLIYGALPGGAVGVVFGWLLARIRGRQSPLRR
jgi:hypothetical protein